MMVLLAHCKDCDKTSPYVSDLVEEILFPFEDSRAGEAMKRFHEVHAGHDVEAVEA